MKKIPVGTGMMVPAMAVGCWRIGEKAPQEVEALISAAMEAELTFFDHADIYGGGAAEEAFGKAAKMLKLERSEIFLQTKCGIRQGFYDFSKEHILRSVEGSLRRLQTDYVDFLLLHRPDTLMEPDEVAQAFAELKTAGKVRCFGVSNFNPMQMELLSQATSEQLTINQLQFGVAHTGLIDSGLNVNIESDKAAMRDGSVLEYCRVKKILLQAWSPLQYGMFEGLYWANEKYGDLVKVVDELAAEKKVSRQALTIAWIMRHPAPIQPICGTTNATRLKDLASAAKVSLSREEWYRIYRAAGNVVP